MNFVSLYFTALCVLIGEEGEDFVYFERDPDQWAIVGLLHRN